MWSPLLGVQKPCQLEQGKRFQEGPAAEPPAAAVAAQPAGASQVRSRSGHASWAAKPVGEMTAGWRLDRGVPPLWDVKVQGVPPLWEVKEKLKMGMKFGDALKAAKKEYRK